MDYIRDTLTSMLIQQAPEFRNSPFTAIYFTFNLYGIELTPAQIIELNEILFYFLEYISLETKKRFSVFQAIVKPGFIQFTANYGRYCKLEQVKTISGFIAAPW